MNKLSIIIVHWNNPDLLRNQLSELTRNKDLQITVVDNASSKSVGWIKKDFPDITLIENKVNRGYASACNQGILKSNNEWLLFLNPDVELKSGELKSLLNEAEEYSFDASSPHSTSTGYDKALPNSLSLLFEFTPLGKLIPKNIFTENKTLFGGCLLIKKNVLQELGGWDERFFLWFEDSDLTKRLVDNGYKIGWLDRRIKHQGGASFNNMNDQSKKDIFFNSMQIYALKHFTAIGQMIVHLIKNKYSKRKLLPKLSEGTSLTIPNVDENILKTFFNKNENLLSEFSEITIVTSALTNIKLWEWRRKYPEIKFISLSHNKGFASTVNIGFRTSTGKYLATVNDDTILRNNWLNVCLKYFKSDTGSVNPIIYKMNNSVETAGIKILDIGKAELLTKLSNKLIDEVDGTNAAAVIYEKEALNKVGLFDEKFGSYLEDIDLSLRLKKSGYKNIVVYESKITHVGQSSSSKFLGSTKNYLDFKNWLLVIGKNWGVRKIIFNLPGIILERLRNLSGILKSI